MMISEKLYLDASVKRPLSIVPQNQTVRSGILGIMTKVTVFALGLVLGALMTFLFIPEAYEEPEPPEWCEYGEYTKKEWELKKDKPTPVLIEVNGSKLIVSVRC